MADYYTRNTKSMSVYDSIVVFEKGNVGQKKPLDSGPQPSAPPETGETFIIRTH